MAKIEETETPEIGRREFLEKGGRFAAATPAAVTMLLSTSLASEAVAKSGGGRRKRPERQKWRRKMERKRARGWRH